MKRTININFQGQLVTIEETAYHLLNQYIQSLKDYFKLETDGSEIVNDIENRIAELFGNRLKHGIACITDEDVTSIINTIGRPEEFDIDYEDEENANAPKEFARSIESEMPPPPNLEPKKSLYRNVNDKIIGGVCSGIANYLKLDPVFVRLLFVLLFSLLFWVYIILWIVLSPRVLDNNVSKRLYRNPNDKFIGGVCGGIAAYFKIDTWIPRVLFLLPLFLNIAGVFRVPFFAFNNIFNNMFGNFHWNWNINGTFIFIYIILWIIMPKAASVKQKLEMMGEEEYLKSLRATVSGSVAQVKSRTESDNLHANVQQNKTSDSDEHHLYRDDLNNHSVDNNRALPPPIEPIYRSSGTHSHERSGCLNALVVLLKVVFFGIAGIIAASLMISLFVLIFTGAHFIPLKSLFVNDGYENSLLWLSVILSLAVPMLGITIWIVRRVMKVKSRPIIGYAVAGFWFLGIVAGLMLSYRITKKFSTERIKETEIVLAQPSGSNFYVELSKYPSEYYRITPSFSNFDELPMYDESENFLLFNRIEIKNRESKDSLYHVKTTFKTFGENSKAAKANLKEFDFRVQQNDSILYIPQFFAVPKSQGFRSQTVIVEIFTPSNINVRYDENIVIP